jgi:cyclohexa-1,5-dienecarbonyl-CoA hydratase
VSADYQLIHVALVEDGGVLDIHLDGDKGNILSMAMMGELERALDAHRDHASLRMVMLRGSGKRFSYGASVEEHTKARVGDMLPAFHAFIRKVALFPVPIAALVEGHCLGGAFELVLACHLVFATPRARFACPEIKLGVFPPVLAVLGSERLSGGTCERLLYTGGELGAEQAERIGWLAALLSAEGDAREQLLDYYRERLAPLSGFALRQATFAMRRSGGIEALLGEPLERAERHYLDAVVGSHDGNEGIAAFLERREPKWSHA